MLRRVSVNFLLQSAIAVVGVALVAVLAVGAWSAWSEVATASRLERIAEVEGQAFRVLHNLRLDRSFTVRVLEHDGTPDPVQMRQVTQSRAAELPALAAALAGLRQIDMPNGDAAAGELDAAAQKFTTLAKESDADFTKPKSERRAGLPKEFETAATDLLGVLDRISDALVGLAKYQDPFVDQMMAMRDAAWIVRENGGDASVIVSTALMAKQRLTAAQWQHEVNLIGRTEAGWAMVQKLRNGAALPTALNAAIDKTRNGFFGADFLARRDEMVAMLAAGQMPSIAVNDWTSQTVPRLGTVTDLAEAALAAAKQHAGEQLSAARGTLITKLAMLLGATRRNSLASSWRLRSETISLITSILTP